MQYKIPVQIENEDPIVLGLSLKQLAIIMVGGGIAYSIFNTLVNAVGQEIAAIPSLIVVALTLTIALFKQYEMTFVPFVLALLRYNINYKERKWEKSVDSFSPLDIGFIAMDTKTQDSNVDFSDKLEKIKNLEDNLSKI